MKSNTEVFDKQIEVSDELGERLTAIDYILSVLRRVSSCTTPFQQGFRCPAFLKEEGYYKRRDSNVNQKGTR